MKNKLAWLFVTCFLLNTAAVHAQLAAGHDKFLGCIAKGTGDEGMTPDSLFLDYWNQLTPENAGKHGLYETNRDRYQPKALDEIYSFARNNNIPLKQHTFLFWCCGAESDWLLNLADSEIRAELEEWMMHYFENYPETAFVEVVNEPFQSPPPAAVRNALGGDQDYAWVRWIFKKAREHAPAQTQLWVNENNVLKGGDRIEKYKELIGYLKEDGTIDAIGLQGHWLEQVSAGTIRNSLDQMDDQGLPLYITEYEVSAADDKRQKEIWRAQFPVFWEYAAVKGVTLWGYKENEIWREDAYLLREDGTERPALRWLRNYLESK
jgi:endo-1,4-beta-xylanase